MKNVDTRSILLKRPGEKAALLFHGLGGTSFEVRGLTEHLFERGISVSAPTLSFHQSRDLSDLKNSTLETWKRDAEDAYDEIADYKKIVVGGISNGAFLAAHLALRHPSSGLITICPPIHPGLFFLRCLPQEKILGWLSRRFEYLPRFDYKMVKDWSLARDLPRFNRLPSHFPHHALLLAGEIRNRISEIKTPILIIQAKHDNRVDPRGARYLYAHVGSERKKLFVAEHSGHVVLLDVDRKAVFDEIASFIEKL